MCALQMEMTVSNLLLVHFVLARHILSNVHILAWLKSALDLLTFGLYLHEGSMSATYTTGHRKGGSWAQRGRFRVGV